MTHVDFSQDKGLSTLVCVIGRHNDQGSQDDEQGLYLLPVNHLGVFVIVNLSLLKFAS